MMSLRTIPYEVREAPGIDLNFASLFATLPARRKLLSLTQIITNEHSSRGWNPFPKLPNLPRSW